ncbi:MAG: hypothetical protein WC519_02670 [Parcubacteria group bacterium]
MITIKTIKIEDIWQKDERVEKWRKLLIPMIQYDVEKADVKYDSQDLEHQVLFRLLTDEKITIQNAFYEQKEIVVERMKIAKISPEKLFCWGDDREQESWRMEWGKDKEELFAVRGKEIKEIIF